MGEEGPPSLEYIQARDLFPQKECHFSTFKQCEEWLKRLNRAIAHPARLEELFALAFHAWCLGGNTDDEDQHLHLCRPGDHVRHRMEVEVKRMGFDMQNAWRVSDINNNYKLCSSYPQKLLVPVWITDKELESVASFRSWKRIPVVVYRHQRNGAVIARCSQPEISWWGWRNTEDEYLVTSIAKACQLDAGPRACRTRGDGPDSSDSDFDSSLTGCPTPDASSAAQKLLILDARSYTAAVANRAKGGGCECEEYYPNCEVMFMGMANIHSIRNSFQSLRAVCSQIPDPGNWLSALESTRWLQHLSVMLKAASLVCSAVEREGRPVLVHCSDGWDRTPQIVALAKILLDPFYRTIEGFQVLVETEVKDMKLVQHTYSCLYGTFLCNNAKEREARNVYKRTCSIWSLLRNGNKNFQNFLYIPCHDMVLQPVCHTRALQLWTAVYLPSSSPCTAAEDAMEIYLSPSAGGEEFSSRSLDRLPKTRSMDNLVSACENGVTLTRTSSDPNLNKHCQESNQPAAIQSSASSEDPPEPGCEETSSSISREDDLGVEPCLTTQPLPSLPHPLAVDQAPPLLVTNQAPPQIPISSPQEIRTAENTNPPPLCNGFAHVENASGSANSEAIAPMEASVETLTEQSAIPPSRKAIDLPIRNGELVPARERPPPADYAKAARRLISQSQLTELSLLGSQWDSVQGLVQSACGGAIQHGSYHSRRLANKLLRAQAGSANGGPCCRRDPLRAPGSPIQSGWFSAVRNSSYAALCSSAASSLAMGPSFRQLLPSHSSPSSSGSPAPAYLDDDGLPVAVDAVQQRLRQIEASYKQEVEVLRRQVRQLQLKLESKQFCTPPSEPDVDYEDDITCLRESDGSDEEDSLSSHSEDRLSEGSWDRVERKDTEVTRWVPDHMASHCFNCDCEFWIAKRRHHCRNCGNVFCKDCCHLKLPIPDQQLYDPVLVCNTCHDLLLESRTRELRSQQLKKAIATASS
ncbi:myotubularin-related protein 4-like [Sinocyclocheilus anshuiensis]|uniref:myotubularin-related protein 4-like n=1 Tax=Sinocyclocheilus anshuiensis TaxID=1608454 RepID=UPI0007B91AC8|nr:PREDICTED: myotubularin-related protein 4-like [Sinocyclocheilus anshuiensis]